MWRVCCLRLLASGMFGWTVVTDYVSYVGASQSRYEPLSLPPCSTFRVFIVNHSDHSFAVQHSHFIFWDMASSSSSSPEISSADPVQSFSYKDATKEEVLEDLSRCVVLAFRCILQSKAEWINYSSRFILNLPDEELTSLERLCFQVEQAYVYVYVKMKPSSWLITLPLVIGSTKTLSANKIQSFRLYHWRSSPRCCSAPVHFWTSGVILTNKRSTILCSTKPESRFAGRSCWMLQWTRLALSSDSSCLLLNHFQSASS